mmetsp:Transcript_15228/g.57480  ORF Transcript_15228/g.57480 Transcript_15228/m.57480 type:complete len:549 (+) Transcript_15228:3209-4855(+)
MPRGMRRAASAALPGRTLGSDSAPSRRSRPELMSNTTCATRDANAPSVRELLPPGLPPAAASSVSVEAASAATGIASQARPSLVSMHSSTAMQAWALCSELGVSDAERASGASTPIGNSGAVADTAVETPSSPSSGWSTASGLVFQSPPSRRLPDTHARKNRWSAVRLARRRLACFAHGTTSSGSSGEPLNSAVAHAAAREEPGNFMPSPLAAAASRAWATDTSSGLARKRLVADCGSAAAWVSISRAAIAESAGCEWPSSSFTDAASAWETSRNSSSGTPRLGARASEAAAAAAAPEDDDEDDVVVDAKLLAEKGRASAMPQFLRRRLPTGGRCLGVWFSVSQSHGMAHSGGAQNPSDPTGPSASSSAIEKMAPSPATAGGEPEPSEAAARARASSDASASARIGQVDEDLEASAHWPWLSFSTSVSMDLDRSLSISSSTSSCNCVTISRSRDSTSFVAPSMPSASSAARACVITAAMSSLLVADVTSRIQPRSCARSASARRLSANVDGLRSSFATGVSSGETKQATAADATAGDTARADLLSASC